MVRYASANQVKMAFEPTSVQVAISEIQPLRMVTDLMKKTPKYSTIRSSIREVGVIEPPVVARDSSMPGKYLLLDGHLRVEALKELGRTEVVCLVSSDDEAFTYNRRINRLAIIQEHRMILKAIERGVQPARLARALNINVNTLQHRVRLLDGICSEAIELLKDKHVPIGTFSILKKMGAMRQIEVAELMVAMNRYKTSYAKSLLAATPQDQLLESASRKSVKGLSEDQMKLMERESANLDRDFKIAEQSYGKDHLDLVLARGYLGKLIGNARVVQYLTAHYQEILGEFRKLTSADKIAA